MLQNYDFTIKHHPGKEMLVADALSNYVPSDSSEIPFEMPLTMYMSPQRRIQSSRQLSTMTHFCVSLKTQALVAEQRI